MREFLGWTLCVILVLWVCLSWFNGQVAGLAGRCEAAGGHLNHPDSLNSLCLTSDGRVIEIP